MSLDVDDADVAFTLVAEGGQDTFEIPLGAAPQSDILKKFLAADSAARRFECTRVKAAPLALVAQYLRHHHNNEARRIEKPLRNSKIKDVLDEWDYAFVTPLLVGNCKALFDLMLVRLSCGGGGRR